MVVAISWQHGGGNFLAHFLAQGGNFLAHGGNFLAHGGVPLGIQLDLSEMLPLIRRSWMISYIHSFARYWLPSALLFRLAIFWLMVASH